MWVTGEYFDTIRDAAVAARGRLDAEGAPHERLAWIELLWTHAPPAARPLIVRARASGGEAWLFLARDRPDAASSGQSRHVVRAGPIMLGDPDPGLRDALLRAIGSRLRALKLRRVDLAPVEQDQARALTVAFRKAGWTVSKRQAGTTAAIATDPGAFDEYWDRRPASLHEAVGAGSRRLVVEIADRLSAGLWADVEQVGGTDPFLRALAERSSAGNALRLGLVSVGETPVAAQLLIVEDQVATLVWHAQDAEARALFPTAHLAAAMLRYAMNVDRVRRVELGCAPELTDWADERRPLVHLALFDLRAPATWGPALATLVHRPKLD